MKKILFIIVAAVLMGVTIPCYAGGICDDVICADNETCQNGVCEKNCEAMTVETACGARALQAGPSGMEYYSQGVQYTCRDGAFHVRAFCALDECGNDRCDASENCEICPDDCGACSEMEPANIIWPLDVRQCPSDGNDPYEPYYLDNGKISGGSLNSGNRVPIDRNDCRPGTLAPYYIDSSEVPFEWTTGNFGGTFSLEVGTCPFDKDCRADIFSGTKIPYLECFPAEACPDFPNNGPTSHIVTGIPLNGKPVYARLTQYTSEGEFTSTYRFNTLNLEPHIAQPRAGTKINDEHMKFVCGGEGVEDCFFIVYRNTPWRFLGYQWRDYSRMDIPLDGKPVTVFMRYRKNGVWGYLSENYDTIFCGDGIVEEGEMCDDGNTIDDDSCTNSCQFPPFWSSRVGDIRQVDLNESW